MSQAAIAAILLACCGLSLLLSLLFVALARRVAPRIGLVDRPGAAASHKSHRVPTPYGGGTAMCLAAGLPTVAALLLAHTLPPDALAALLGPDALALFGGLREKLAPGLCILAGAVALHVLGLIDDVRALGPGPKLLTMSAVALFVATFADVRIAEFLPAPLSILASAVWIMVVTNAFNFLDNMDGLSAGVAAICAFFLALCGLLAQQALVPALAALGCGAILGFLWFNFPPARIFMGDAGSLVIGYMVAVVAILTSYYDSGAGKAPFALAMPLAVLAVPLYDFLSVTLIRLRERRSPFRGDQRHFSHRLVQRGLSRRMAVLTIYLATAATGLAATLLPGAGLRESVTILAVVVMVLLIVAALESPVRGAA